MVGPPARSHRSGGGGRTPSVWRTACDDNRVKLIDLGRERAGFGMWCLVGSIPPVLLVIMVLKMPCLLVWALRNGWEIISYPGLVSMTPH